MLQPENLKEGYVGELPSNEHDEHQERLGSDQDQVIHIIKFVMHLFYFTEH